MSLFGRMSWVGAALLSACSFPGALTCDADDDCQRPWRCDVRTSRCTKSGLASSDAAASLDAESDSSAGKDTGPAPDAGVPDAAPPDLGPLGAFCASLCPEPGACEANLSVGDASFEEDSGAWEFLSPAVRATIAFDLQPPRRGAYMANIRVDHAAAEFRAFSRIDQFFATRELPAGHYRLCFAWRTLSGPGNNCTGAVAVHQTLVLRARDPVDPTAIPTAEPIWSVEDVGGWCDAAVEHEDHRATAWTDACVDFERTTPWLDPGIGFVTALAGTPRPDNWHAFLVDDVRLRALDCSTWR